MNRSPTQFWSVPSSKLLQQLQTTTQGLVSDEPSGFYFSSSWDREKVFQFALKICFYFLAATQRPDPQESFSIDRIGGGETGYIITLGDDPLIIHENRQVYLQPFQVFFCSFYIG
ncbi:MAG: hypothetical protein H6Q43_3120 [Deltaproteobacteria bacterium]|nr:hypothetical protein [Deltaproteobacteria bacterium]